MKFTFRIWLWLVIVLLSLISIFSLPPQFLKEGVVVDAVSPNSSLVDLGLLQGQIITSINGNPITGFDDYQLFVREQSSLGENESRKVTITTDSSEVVGLFGSSLVDEFSVSSIPSTRIKTGLDLRGGARALVRADRSLSDQDLDDLIAVSEQRLNIYGLSDLKLFKVITSSQERLMGIEIAGSTPGDLEQLIEQQGKFEAKIGNETVFVGGDEDITHVGRTGQDAFISECFEVSGGHACNFQFTIYLSEEAAERHARITDGLGINGSYLSKTLDLFLDGSLMDSLNIGTDLKGSVATRIQISGSETAPSRDEAIDLATLEMKRLQTVLITGSLPFELEIVKLDRLSPKLGVSFTKQLIIAGLFALVAVALLVFIRYRRLKISFALIAVSFSEVLIILGVASLISWNLDLPSIAGIIGAIGTGIDSQLIILDESRDRHESVKQRIKKALFIIVTAFATTLVALIPLTGFLSFMKIGAASAGLLKGFAITTLIGITTGVLISRPAFADMAEQFEKD